MFLCHREDERREDRSKAEIEQRYRRNEVEGKEGEVEG